MKVLIIEDNLSLARGLKKGLSEARFVADHAADGISGSRLALIGRYDAIILDMHLPGKNGIEVAHDIRKRLPSIPILVLTVEDAVEQKVEMLSLCDDYVVKPFSIDEIIARLRALFRRGPIQHGEVLEWEDLRMDVGSGRVTRAGRDIQLRNREFALLEHFLRHPEQVFDRATLLERVWDRNADPFSNTVDVHIRLLRKKIDDGCDRKLIHTIPGRGYRLGPSHTAQ